MQSSSETFRLRFSHIGSGLIIAVYLALKPIYTNQSGSLQYSDYFMAAAILFMLFKNRKIRATRKTVSIMRPLIWLVIHICLVNLLWYLLDGSHYNYSYYSLYYVYNVGVFACCLLIYENIGYERLRDALRLGILLSSLVSAGSMLLNYTNVRSTGMFNNPNQLGYYGVVLVSFSLFLRKDRFRLPELIALATGIWCVVASLSKGAFLSLMIQLIMCSILLDERRNTKAILRRILLILVMGTVVYVFFFTDLVPFPAFERLLRMRTRILNMSNERDTDLGTGRGYARIAEMGAHFLWGMGEGNFGRFETMQGAEVHSTYASMMVCYGLIGISLLIFFLMKVCGRGRQRIPSIALLSGVLLYSVTHNGGRNTLVWMLFAFVYVRNVMLVREPTAAGETVRR